MKEAGVWEHRVWTEGDGEVDRGQAAGIGRALLRKSLQFYFIGNGKP